MKRMRENLSVLLSCMRDEFPDSYFIGTMKGEYRIRSRIVLRGAAVSALCLMMTLAPRAMEPADPDLIPAGRNVLNYFESVYKKRMVSAIRKNRQAINTCSGKTPVIVECDLCGWNAERWGEVYKKNIRSQMDQVKSHYHDEGGIPALCFHWPNPLTDGGRFPDSQEDLTEAQFEKIVTPGTGEYETMINDLDRYCGVRCMKSTGAGSGGPAQANRN